VKAIRQYEFGAADTLRLEDVPDPVPGDGQVLIEVAAAGVHLLDTSIRAGTTGGPFPLADAAAAHIALEGRATTGKVVLTP
jgi:NADPH2:quinone reductase